MVKNVSRTLALVLTVAGFSPLASAKETPDEALKLATTPIVQIDDWAAWWPHRHAEKLTERDKIVSEGRPLQLVFVGDSITHGWENSGKAMWAERFGPRGAYNIGFSGDRTEHVLWRLGVGSGNINNEIAGLKPKLFVVMIGTNNTGHRQEAPAATAMGIELIVDRLLEQAPESQVLLLAVFPRGEKSDDPLRKINDGVNERIAELGDRDRVEYLDISDVFLDEDGTLPKSVMPDLLHPNAKGYKLWADAIEPHVARLLGE